MFIGIDPGKSGGMAIIDREGRYVAACRMPDSDSEVLDVFKAWPSARAVLEFVRSSPQMGVASAFTFGCSYGALKMALAAAGVPYNEVTPLKWQRALGCLTKGDKNVSKARATQLFPGIKVTHAIGDALLLAEYCRRLELGQHA